MRMVARIMLNGVGEMVTKWRKYFFKSFTWSVLAIFSTFLVCFLITNDFMAAGVISIWDRAIKFLIYMAHEEAWGG